MRLLSVIALGALFYGCSVKAPELKPGWWRGEISLQGQRLPFNFEVTRGTDGHYEAYLKNSTEKIRLDEIRFDGDSVIFRMHIFDTELKAKVEGDSLKGFYIKNFEKNYRLPFRAAAGQDYRFNLASASTPDFTGTYGVTFSNKDESLVAVGIFLQTSEGVTGTFLTPEGDYRYLEGNIENGQLNLSTFDGHHAFLFSARLSGDSIKGEYWSGRSFHQQWSGIKDEKAKLPDAESLTLLKEGYDRIDFSFPDLNGKRVSPADERFKNKVLILQIFGTWCPNCMDETKFLTTWYKEHTGQGVEILGLAYERKDDFVYASGRVKQMKEKLDVPYDFVVAGTYDKKKAAETLPMLNKVLAFPTTIFIGKDGKVKHIRTGFEGPGTGIYHEQFKQRFNEIVLELLNENLTSKQ
jgi:thiol-disulfide isomerase/thioredoxin